jgi:fatty acid desaturase
VTIKTNILSFAVGLAIAGANFAALNFVVRRMLGAPDKRALAIVLALLKLAILVLVVWVVIKYLPINIVWFLAGLTVALVAGCVILLLCSGDCFARQKRARNDML